MNYLGKSKIGKQYSKPDITYPIIRLPLKCSEVIGTSIQIYKTEHAGQSAFVIIPDNEESESLKLEVAQLTLKVAQPKSEDSSESRLAAIESKIKELNNFLLKNYDDNPTEKREKRWARGDSNARPPPCEGDVITS